MSNPDIGRRIHEARLAKEWKRVKLAAEADITPNTVRNYEDGYTNPNDLNTLRKIADALGVELMWLIEGRVGEVA